ncbi:MAG: hypothetical protein AAF495_14455 [Pseudomonadota bacterium]
MEEALAARVPVIYGFDIGGVGFTMTQSQITRALEGRGFSHTWKHLQHTFQKELPEGEGTEVFQVSYGSNGGGPDPHPHEIRYSYRQNLVAGDSYPDWSDSVHAERASGYISKLCDGLPTEGNRVCPPPERLDGAHQIRMSIDHVTGTDGRRYDFVLQMRAPTFQVAAYAVANPNATAGSGDQAGGAKGPPDTAEEMAAELRAFGQQCQEILDTKTLSSRKLRYFRNCAKGCNDYADQVLKNGLNAKTESQWDLCRRLVANAQ